MLQKQISDWARETFGPSSPATLYNRGEDEFRELKDAVYNKGPEEIGMECADVLHLLFQICESQGIDLIRATEEKFHINRNRKWKVNGDGTGQHI